MKKTRLILVGGFLGTGKTTLLGEAAQRLTEQGLRVALITNDQTPELVDSGILKLAGWAVGEVAGGCFCCRFDDLVRTVNELIQDANPDVILGEPVGSCTDLSATVLQPLKDGLADQFDLAPLSVLIDPGRLQDALGQDPVSLLHPSARYIIRKQLEEADIIVLNKADQVAALAFQKHEERVRGQFPGRPLFSMSALNGQGVAAWLKRVSQRTSAGRTIADVDYDVYAEGEAVLGWLNATASLRPKAAVDWRAWSLELLGALQLSFAARSAEIAHMKMLIVTESKQSLSANLASSQERAIVRGQIRDDSPVTLVLNARVQMAPLELRAAIEGHLGVACGETIQFKIDEIQSVSPGRPEPVHRYATVV